jgi:hypothetical protein
MIDSEQWSGELNAHTVEDIADAFRRRLAGTTYTHVRFVEWLGPKAILVYREVQLQKDQWGAHREREIVTESDAEADHRSLSVFDTGVGLFLSNDRRTTTVTFGRCDIVIEQLTEKGLVKDVLFVAGVLR